MSPPKDIAGSGLNRTVSNSLDFSPSPSLAFHSPPSSFRSPPTRGSFNDGRSGSISGHAGINARQLKPFDTKDIKVLLLENVNAAGVDILKEQGYQVEALKSSLPEDELIAKIRQGHVIG